MPTLTERIAAQRAADAAATQEQALRQQKRDEQRQAAAGARLRDLISSQLNIQTDAEPTLLRESKQYSNHRPDTTYLGMEIDGYWLAIAMPSAFAANDWEHDLDNRVLYIVIRCPNGHAMGQESRNSNGWDAALVRAAARQDKLAIEGACYACVTEGKTRALRQQLFDLVRLGSRDTALAIVRALAEKSYFTDDVLLAAINAAQSAY